jgi:uncharacterized protein YdeI (YjbR/CyaY-like superfamily)
MTPEIKKFIKQILIDAGQTDLPKEVEEQMIEDLNTRLEDRLILTAMEAMEPKKQMELEKITGDIKDPAARAQKIEAFLTSNIKDYQNVFAKALMDFRDLYISATKK